MSLSTADLLDIAEIEQLKHRYVRLLDTKQWDEWRALFTEDAELEASEARTDRAIGPFLADLQERLATATTVHQPHEPVIELNGPGEARAVWPMFDYVEYPYEGQRRGKRGWGHYVERYRKVDGRWRIASLKLTRIRQDPLTGPPVPPTTPARLADDWLPAQAPLEAGRLADLEAIRQLKARYFRYLDLKRWADWRGLFGSRARFEVSMLPGSLDADAFVETVARNHRATDTVHQGHAPEIAFIGPNVARGIWALEDHVERPPDYDRPSNLGHGHYEEQYRREDGEWRIEALRLSYLRHDRWAPVDDAVRFPRVERPDWLEGTALPGVDELGDVHAIRQLKARAVTLLDEGRWAEWRALFADDARLEGTLADGGPDALAAATARHLEGARTAHHAHMPEIRVAGDGTARAVWSCTGYVEWPGGERRRGATTHAHHEEAYRLEGGEWRIAALRIVPLRADPLTGPALPEHQTWTQLADGRWLPPGARTGAAA